MENKPLPLEELTLSQLQAEAVKLGMPEADTKKFPSKAPLIATINTLKAAAASAKVETLTPPVNPKEERADESRWLGKKERMRKFLESQPKVRILIPLDPGEKQGVVKEVMENGRKETIYVSGSVWSKTFNGYKVIIPKGMYVSVAEHIAENIEQEYHQTQHAGDRWRTDRIDNKTGRPVSEQL